MPRDEEDDSSESVYDDEGREDLIENDEISAREEGFMQGYDEASQDEVKKTSEDEDPYDKAFESGKKQVVQEVKPPKTRLPKKPVKKPVKPLKKTVARPPKKPVRKAPKKPSKQKKVIRPKKHKVKPKRVGRKGMGSFMSWFTE